MFEREIIFSSCSLHRWLPRRPCGYKTSHRVSLTFNSKILIRWIQVIMLTLIGLVRNSDKENVTEEAENNVLITVVANSLVSHFNSVSKISLFPAESHPLSMFTFFPPASHSGNSSDLLIALILHTSHIQQRVRSRPAWASCLLAGMMAPLDFPWQE